MAQRQKMDCQRILGGPQSIRVIPRQSCSFFDQLLLVAMRFQKLTVGLNNKPIVWCGTTNNGGELDTFTRNMPLATSNVSVSCKLISQSTLNSEHALIKIWQLELSTDGCTAILEIGFFHGC